MSETAATVIKLLGSLTSPRAAAKYVTVAGCVFLAWRYFEDPVRSTGIPDEQLSIVLILLGVGLGSIAGHLISEVGGAGWEAISSRMHSRREAAELQKSEALAAARKVAEDEQFRNDFAATFEHLLLDQKKILRELSISDRNVEILGEESTALKNNGYVIPIVKVSGYTYLTKINPLITEFVQTQWAAELAQRVDEFFDVHGDTAKTLLDLLKEGWEEADHAVSVSVFEGLNQYGGCIKMLEDDEERCISLWFDDYVRELFEERTGEAYDDEAWISIDRLVPPEGAA